MFRRNLRFGTPLLGLMLGLLLVAVPGHGAPVQWLYEVALEVEDQSSSARQQASKVALLEVLGRITGLSSVPRTPAVRDALKAPDLYYNRFVYLQQGSVLKLFFEPASVLTLVKSADLPVWASNRPLVVGWIVVDDSGSREVLTADSESAMVTSLTKRLRQRGVPFRLPLMDLQDQLSADASVIWGRMSSDLDAASARYGGDIVLAGRIRIGSDRQVSSDWVYWHKGDFLTVPLPNQSSTIAVADDLADRLAEQYAVLGRSVATMGLMISGVANPTDYGKLLSYLNSLEYIDAIDVVQVDTEQMRLNVVTRASRSQLMSLLATGGRLMPDDGPALEERGLEKPVLEKDVALVWLTH